MVTKVSIVFLLVALTTTAYYPMAQAGLFDDISKTFSSLGSDIANTACVVQHTSEFNSCYDKIKDAYRSIDYNDVSKDDKKDACCQYLAYRDCVESVAYKRCGSEASKIAESFMKAVKGANSQCDEYNTIFDCMDPIVLVAVIIVLAIVGIAILGCLIRICQSCCKC